MTKRTLAIAELEYPVEQLGELQSELLTSRVSRQDFRGLAGASLESADRDVDVEPSMLCVFKRFD